MVGLKRPASASSPCQHGHRLGHGHRAIGREARAHRHRSVSRQHQEQACPVAPALNPSALRTDKWPIPACRDPSAGTRCPGGTRRKHPRIHGTPRGHAVPPKQEVLAGRNRSRRRAELGAWSCFRECYVNSWVTTIIASRAPKPTEVVITAVVTTDWVRLKGGRGRKSFGSSQCRTTAFNSSSCSTTTLELATKAVVSRGR